MFRLLTEKYFWFYYIAELYSFDYWESTWLQPDYILKISEKTKGSAKC